MIKLRTILAGTAVAVISQFAAAQGSAPVIITVPASEAPSNPNDPAYTDQSRLNQTNDPLVKRRIANSASKTGYKAEKHEAHRMRGMPASSVPANSDTSEINK